MANTINAYDADVRIPQFLGLKQYGDLMNGNPVYADHAVNMNTKGGALMPMAAPKELPGAVTDPGDDSVTYPIETLMKVNRRWPNDEIMIAAAGGRIWAYQDERWNPVGMPEGISTFISNVWSWLDYEMAVEGDDDPHDIVIMSNANDGMFILDGKELTMIAFEAPYRFGVIERHAERIWGAGIPDYPDRLVYSRPYLGNGDLSIAWEEAGPEEQPEDGAGMIDQPSWDGDSFIALRTFGDQLIAFKRTRVWRILGTDPGVYEFKEQFGGGSYVPQTIAVDSTRIYMLSRDGIMAYDGNTVEPFGKEYAAAVWRGMNPQAIENARACLYRGKYYIAVPMQDTLENSTNQLENSAVVTYDLHDGTWLLRRDIRVESWLPCENALYFTTVENPYCIHEYIEDAWESGTATESTQEWISPWNDLGYPNKHKGPFVVYFTPEVQDTPVDFTLTIDTERGIKSKTVRIYPDMGYEHRMSREAKMIRVPFAGNGRRFRMRLQAKGGVPWRICGGILIHLDQETED